MFFANDCYTVTVVHMIIKNIKQVSERVMSHLLQKQKSCSNNACLLLLKLSDTDHMNLTAMLFQYSDFHHTNMAFVPERKQRAG